MEKNNNKTDVKLPNLTFDNFTLHDAGINKNAMFASICEKYNIDHRNIGPSLRKKIFDALTNDVKIKIEVPFEIDIEKDFVEAPTHKLPEEFISETKKSNPKSEDIKPVSTITNTVIDNGEDRTYGHTVTENDLGEKFHKKVTKNGSKVNIE